MDKYPIAIRNSEEATNAISIAAAPPALGIAIHPSTGGGDVDVDKVTAVSFLFKKKSLLVWSIVPESPVFRPTDQVLLTAFAGSVSHRTKTSPATPGRLQAFPNAAFFWDLKLFFHLHASLRRLPTVTAAVTSTSPPT